MNLSTLHLNEFSATRQGNSLSENITTELAPGTVLGVLGPNGVGKSSLLAALAHAGVAHTGTAALADTRLCALRPRHRARLMSMLTQELSAPEELLVTQLVEVGARAGARQHDQRSAAPHVPDQISHALGQLAITHLAHRRLGSLSGGQRQLAQLARVVAQNTPIVLLDEPTSALDLKHQETVAHMMRAMGSAGRVVIAAVHDLNFALSACTHVLLLTPDGTAHIGTPYEVLTPSRIYDVYGVHASLHTAASGRKYLLNEAPTDSPDFALTPQGI